MSARRPGRGQGARPAARGAQEPLAASLALQRVAEREGFDWADSADLWAKLEEEIAELKADAHDPVRAEEELGDVLFMAVNLARHFGLDCARALRGANRRFGQRFGYIMRHAATLPPLGHPQRLAAMEALWQEAKRRPPRGGARVPRRRR